MPPQGVDLAQNKARVYSFIEKYSYFPSAEEANFNRSWTAPAENVVLVTGTTGNVGSDLLHILLTDEKVKKVYALNRVSYEGTSLERVKMQFGMKGLPAGILESEKIVFIDGKLALPDLGLEPEVLNLLRNEVTTIVHNAWPINLMQSLSFYEPCLLGLYNLITFARSFPNTNNLRFLFVSSISIVADWARTKGGELVPEALLDDPFACLGVGYGESKFAGETILARSGLNGTSLRFNQLCGRHADGAWSPMEWPAILLKASMKMGVIIDMIGRCAFLPVDVAAACIRDVVILQETPPVLNFTHPRPVPWDLLTRSVISVLPEGVNYPTMPCWDFMDELSRKATSATRAEIRENPALILVSKFKIYTADNRTLLERKGENTTEHFPHATMGIEKALELCPSLRNAPDISSHSMQLYLKYWKKVGFLDGIVRE